MKCFRQLFGSPEIIIPFPWRCVFEHTRRLKELLLRVPLIVTASLSVEVGLAVADYVRRVYYLKRKSGLLFTALYLKQCRVSLQRYYAGSYSKGENLSVPISLTRSGLPRIIPKRLRWKIARKDDEADRLVRLYLSWFGLSRLIALAPRVSRNTFASIVTPHPDNEGLQSVLGDMKQHFPRLQRMYLPWISTIPLETGMTWEPTWKSTPMTEQSLREKGRRNPSSPERIILPRDDSSLSPPNIFVNLKHELASCAWNINKIHSLPDGVFSPGILFHPRIYYPCDVKRSTVQANDCLEYFEKYVGPWFSTLLPAYQDVVLWTGRLCATIEGDGKRRIFAIGNYVKQRLLFPVHRWAMTVLSRLQSDGTFDQEAPLTRLRPLQLSKVYSFDLKSATDRWPLAVIFELQKCFWGPTLASAIVNGALGLNTFGVGPPLVRRPSEVSFLTGQALGYYGSWALFSLSHHYIVWMAALIAQPDRHTPFTHYAILGDDVVIGDCRVAEEYQRLLERMCVPISWSKSLISDNGTLEFAKRFWTHRLQVDLSPISMRALTMCRTTLGLCQLAAKYKIDNICVLQRLAGAGYRVRARLMTTQSKRWERLKAAASKPLRSQKLPLEWWIGRGYPLNPYLKGRIVSYLLKELKPREIRLFPEQLVFDGEREILERTVVHRWMRQWLAWVSWYHTMMLVSDVSLDQLFEAPICSTSWKRQQFDPKIFLFGLVWKCYDMACGWTLNTCPPFVLDNKTVVHFDRWIFGGYSGKDFIMAPVDLPPTRSERGKDVRM